MPKPNLPTPTLPQKQTAAAAPGQTPVVNAGSGSADPGQTPVPAAAAVSNAAPSGPLSSPRPNTPETPVSPLPSNVKLEQPAVPQAPAMLETEQTLPTRRSLTQMPGTKAPGVPTTPVPATIPASPGFQATPAAGATPISKMANPKKSPLKIVLFAMAGLVGIALVIMVISRVMGGNKTDSDKTGSEGSQATSSGKQVTLSYWGLWENPQVFEEVIADFQKENPNIKVEYKKQSHLDYRERLQTAISSGNGPDIFRFHASWVPMLSEELAALPTKVMSAAQFEQTFYPIMKEQLQYNGQIVGIPLMYDGLALFYNKDILDTAGVSPPTTWPELQTMAKELTVPADRKSTKEIQRAGLAIGNADNIDHFSDILGLLIMQNEGDPSKPSLDEVKEAFIYYTLFMKEDMVWSENLPSSTVAFAREDVAMMFAPSWRAHEIDALNPELNYGIASVPRLGKDRIAWASYWAEGVSSKSQNKQDAWLLLEYLSRPDVMKKLYSLEVQERAFGEIYSRVDLADEIISNEYLAPLLTDAKVATNWYLNSYTHDNGINDQIIKYYKDAINAILQGKDIDEVMSTVELGTEQVLRQYAVQ